MFKPLLISTCVAAALLLTGCNDNKQATEPVVEAQPKEPEWKSWTPLLNGEAEEYKKRYGEELIPTSREVISEHNSIIYYPNGYRAYDVQVASEWPREDRTDVDSYSEPRMLFIWNNLKEGADEETQRKIWSMKVDYSDLRLVHIPQGKGTIRTEAQMSPDGRYLGYMASNNKYIVDLDSGEEVLVGSESGRTQLNWTADSRYVFFGDGWVYKRYEPATGEIAEFTSDEYVHGIKHRYVGDKRIVLHALGYEIYQGSSGVLADEGLKLTADEHTVQRSRINPSFSSIDPLGQWLFASNNAQENIYVNLETQEVEKRSCDIGNNQLGPGGEFAYGGLQYIDTRTCQRHSNLLITELSALPWGISFYNLGGSNE